MINQMIVGERLEEFDGLRLVIVAPSCGLGLAGPKYGGVLGMPLFKRLPVLCVPLRSGPQRGMPHEPTATKSKFHAPPTAVRMSMLKEVAALIVEAASHPQ